jgi:hypothetical protein
MKTSVERLKWFLNFAQLEWTSNVDAEGIEFGSLEPLSSLKELKEWEYLKLKEEVVRFIGGTDPDEPVRFRIKQEPVEFDKNLFPIWPEPSGQILEEEISEWLTMEELAVLSVRSRGYLDSYTKDTVAEITSVTISLRKDATPLRHEEPRKRKVAVPTKVVTKKSKTISFGQPTVSFDMPTATWHIESSPAHLFFIRFGLVLMEEGTSQIQTCPECERAFYRVRKQKYCSKTCINRVSRRKWLQNPKNKKKDRQWAQERYKQRVQEKTSKKVRVRSRKKGEEN